MQFLFKYIGICNKTMFLCEWTLLIILHCRSNFILSFELNKKQKPKEIFIRYLHRFLHVFNLFIASSGCGNELFKIKILKF
jgi:hypothetical protein